MPWRHHCDFPEQWRCKNFDYGSRHNDGDGAHPTNHCTCCCTYTSLAVDIWTETTPCQDKTRKTEEIVIQKKQKHHFGCQCARLQDHPQIQPLHTWLHFGTSAVELHCSLQDLQGNSFKKCEPEVAGNCMPTPPSLYIRRTSGKAWCRRSCSSCLADLHNHIVFLEWSSASVGKLQHCLSFHWSYCAFLGIVAHWRNWLWSCKIESITPISKTAVVDAYHIDSCWYLSFSWLIIQCQHSTHITWHDLNWDAVCSRNAKHTVTPVVVMHKFLGDMTAIDSKHIYIVH